MAVEPLSHRKARIDPSDHGRPCACRVLPPRRRAVSATTTQSLAAGVRQYQYWVIDPLTNSATIHDRRGDTWRKERLGTRSTITTPLLPEFALKLGQVLAAA